MYIKFDYLILKNFSSYGNSETKFTFTEGMNLISGKNGNGKSSIAAGLTYNLFGKPYKDIKVADLINRKNKKGLYTECQFVKESDTFKIVRTQLPNKLLIYKNGQELNSLSSKSLDQEEINKILGIDYRLFKMIIAIEVNSSKPFLSLPLADKREVVENIFNIKIFGEMLKLLKKKTSALKIDKTINETSIKKLETSISVLRTQIKEIENSIENFDTDKQRELEETNNLITVEKNKIETLKTSIKELEDKISSIEIDTEDYQTQLSSSVSLKMTEENNVKTQTKQIAFIKKHKDCPLCGSELTEEHKTKELEKIEKTIVKSNKTIDKLSKTIDSLNGKIKENNTKILNKNSLKESLNRLKDNLSNTNFNITRLEKEIEKISGRSFSLDISAFRKQYDDNVLEYKETTKSYNSLLTQLKINENAAKMLSEDGIKSYFFKRLIPLLNMKINEYIDLFELPVTINFNDTLDDNIAMNGSPDKNLPYLTFSEGEKKRIDIAVLLSFLHITKIISNWNCNVLLLDEILDSATDADGLDKMLSSIKNMCVIDDKLCCYVISHKDASTEHFDRVIKIKKVAGFSKLDLN